ncbi:VOC family protein [Amycolatopsis thermoflava]|uniref:VOC family protein n=1 Tax=Amycolatopsis thermoflava TaxID=84480 RepID=UPI0036487239
MGRVVHFEIPVDEPERAGAFYRGAFGWTVRHWDTDYWPMVSDAEDGAGAEGALTRRSQAPEGVVVYIGVDDVEAAVARVREAGGSVVAGPMPIPKTGWAAHVRDSEGNLVGLFQEDAEAPPPAG